MYSINKFIKISMKTSQVSLMIIIHLNVYMSIHSNFKYTVKWTKTIYSDVVSS